MQTKQLSQLHTHTDDDNVKPLTTLEQIIIRSAIGIHCISYASQTNKFAKCCTNHASNAEVTKLRSAKVKIRSYAPLAMKTHQTHLWLIHRDRTGELIHGSIEAAAYGQPSSYQAIQNHDNLYRCTWNYETIKAYRSFVSNSCNHSTKKPFHAFRQSHR